MENDQNLKKDHKGLYIKLGVILFFSLSVLLVMVRYVFLEKDVQKATKASGQTVTLSFTPSTVTTSPNQDFSVAVKAKPSADTIVRGYYFKIVFDKTKVQLKDITYKMGVVSSDLGNNNSGLASINQNGFIEVQGEIQTASGQILTKNQESEIINLIFTSTSTQPSLIAHQPSGEAFYVINVDGVLSEMPIASAGGVNINGTEVPPEVPGNIKLNLKLKFQGINNDPADEFDQMVVKVGLGSNSTVNVSPNPVKFVPDNQGIWTATTSFNTPAKEGYYLFIKGPKHIQKKICDLQPKETFPGTYRCSKGNINLIEGENNLDLTGVLLLAGDLPEQDGIVNSYDTSLVRNNLGKNDADSLRQSDLNLDGVVNSVDYSLIISALSVKVDEGD